MQLAREKLKTPCSIRNAIHFAALVAAVLAVTTGCNRVIAVAGNISPGVAMESSNMTEFQNRTVRIITAAPRGIMKECGLAGIMGGARVKLLKTGTHELLLPMPQLTEAQIPVGYAITTTPPKAAKEYRLRVRGDSNVVVSVQLNGDRDEEVQMDWSAIILIAGKSVTPDRSPPEPYLRETSCVQCDAKPVKMLADKLWPASGKTDDYAANIQEFIRNLKQKKQPFSLDALGILESGGNWICTANANLAAALLRSKHIPARSVAVIPPTGGRLEMHRIVGYFESGQWRQFDPSSLHTTIPLKPWQNIIMARTTIADEGMAMTPRMGTSFGCPYGQELEFLDGGVTLWGQNFFGRQASRWRSLRQATKPAIGPKRRGINSC